MVNLWKYQNNVLFNTDFIGYTIKGYLHKNDNSMFNTSLRYFVLNFNDACVYLYKNSKENKTNKALLFRKITECRLPTFYEQELAKQEYYQLDKY